MTLALHVKYVVFEVEVNTPREWYGFGLATLVCKSAGVHSGVKWEGGGQEGHQ